jgi:hypothetical protein
VAVIGGKLLVYDLVTGTRLPDVLDVATGSPAELPAAHGVVYLRNAPPPAMPYDAASVEFRNWDGTTTTLSSTAAASPGCVSETCPVQALQDGKSVAYLDALNPVNGSWDLVVHDVTTGNETARLHAVTRLHAQLDEERLLVSAWVGLDVYLCIWRRGDVDPLPLWGNVQGLAAGGGAVAWSAYEGSVPGLQAGTFVAVP